MSDNFPKEAKKEVSEDIKRIKIILDSCKNDSDISANATYIEKHLHQIKGLAPMMGQNDLGEISQLADKLLKHIIANGPVVDSYQILIESVITMKQLLNGEVLNPEKLKEKIRQTF